MAANMFTRLANCLARLFSIPVHNLDLLDSADVHRVNAALGWLGLGNAEEARAELAAIPPEHQSHSAVLEARWLLCTHEKNWREGLEIAEQELASVPGEASGWLHRAYALRRVEGGGLPQAWDALLPAAEKFPKESVIAYNLSCYACQMSQLDIARDWFKRAVATGGKDIIKKMALEDEDLKPLWSEIQAL